jgi:MoaA/NifB/PqqE/SkfB family radical SAM enzyme
MYCGDIRHEYNQGQMLSLEEMQSYWTQVYNKTKHLGKRYKLVISGGEPTINKNLLPMLEWLRSNYTNQIMQIGLCTNGSASQSHYLKLFQYLDWISFSIHTEYLDEQLFFSKANACNFYANTHNKSFMIKIVPEPWAKNSINKFVETCKVNKINFDLIERLDLTRQTRDYPIFTIKEYD